MKDFLMWNKIARIILSLAKRLDVNPRRALDIFYGSNTSKMLGRKESGLYLMSDEYIVEDIIAEIQYKQNAVL